MTCGKEGDIPLEHVGENPMERERLEKEKRKEGRKVRRREEK